MTRATRHDRVCFTQTDPIGLRGGVNLYGYAAGDPINLRDPFGLSPWCWLKTRAAREAIADEREAGARVVAANDRYWELADAQRANAANGVYIGGSELQEAKDELLDARTAYREAMDETDYRIWALADCICRHS